MKQISEFFQSQLGRFDELDQKADNVTSLMKERKIALISAVVTGKIDVQVWNG